LATDRSDYLPHPGHLRLVKRMPEDLPIYSESMLRTRLQFADLERLKCVDTSTIWEKSDAFIEQLEGGANVRRAREAVQEVTKDGLLQIHSMVFGGTLRQHTIQPLFRGQDCPDPEFIDRSLDNLFNWFTAESVAEIHPIERAALMITRIADIWPFDSGNLTVAIMLSNIILRQSGLPPFFVLPEHKREFTTVIAQAIVIETQPIVNAIYKTIKRELEALASG
jgi:fido (protein-threonine AMPylation protein)